MCLDCDKLKEECGVFGIFCKENNSVSEFTYYGLMALQHRGQESAGISVSNDGKITTYKGMGLVSDVFTNEVLDNLNGNIAIGHVRYSTCGGSEIKNAQPLQNGDVALAHNGNLVNADIIKELLESGGEIFETTSDSEVILKMITRKCNKGIEKSTFDSLKAIKGAYAIVMVYKNKLIGIRDPYGIRPLVIGKTQEGAYILSSESCAIDNLGGTLIRDVLPGEIVIIDENGIESLKFSEQNTMGHCAFEQIYFARPDSVIDGVNVYKARFNAGRLLARQRKIEADIVVGVPDSGIPAAVGYAKESGIPYGVGFIKNKYIGRSFIKPTQELRQKAVMVKLNPLKLNIAGKRVIIVDDSLVRGNTSKILIEMMRRAGAIEVHFMSASPAVKYSCYFGIDTAHRSELIASKMSVQEIREEIGADSLEFLSLENLYLALESMESKEICGNLKNFECCENLESSGEKKYCMGCFNGVYPVDAPLK